MAIRGSDRASLTILSVTLAQMFIGVGVIVASAQRRADSYDAINAQAVLNAEMVFRTGNLADRIAAVEALQLPQRLAIIEKVQIDGAAERADVKRLIYGLIATVAGSVIAQAIQIRDAFMRRRSPGHP